MFGIQYGGLRTRVSFGMDISGINYIIAAYVTRLVQSHVNYQLLRP